MHRDCPAAVRAAPQLAADTVCKLTTDCQRAQRWPLLADGQDPNGLEALVAYHLHRLRLTGRALAPVRYLSRPGLQDLTQARRPLSDHKAALLAQALNVPPEELTRPLTSDEATAWAFYRASARAPRYVWRQAQSLWRSAGPSNRQAANVMGLPQHAPANALNLRRRPITLTFPPALRLTTALNIAEGPNMLLKPLRKGPR